MALKERRKRFLQGISHAKISRSVRIRERENPATNTLRKFDLPDRDVIAMSKKDKSEEVGWLKESHC